MGSMRKRGSSYEFQVSLGYDMSGKKLEKRRTWKIPMGMTDKKAEKEARRKHQIFRFCHRLAARLCGKAA